MSADIHAAVSRFATAAHDWVGLSNILRQDIRLLLEALGTDTENQMLRRSFVRASWAYVEAMTFSVKNLMSIACQHGSERFAPKDQAFLLDQRAIVDVDGEMTTVRDPIRTLDNIKQTFRLAAKLLEIELSPDFAGGGWQHLRKSILIRHRLTHPKVASELAVTGADLETLRKGIGWFTEMFNSFEAAMMQKNVAAEP